MSADVLVPAVLLDGQDLVYAAAGMRRLIAAQRPDRLPTTQLDQLLERLDRATAVLLVDRDLAWTAAGVRLLIATTRRQPSTELVQLLERLDRTITALRALTAEPALAAAADQPQPAPTSATRHSLDTSPPDRSGSSPRVGTDEAARLVGLSPRQVERHAPTVGAERPGRDWLFGQEALGRLAARKRKGSTS